VGQDRIIMRGHCLLPQLLLDMWDVNSHKRAQPKDSLIYWMLSSLMKKISKTKSNTHSKKPKMSDLMKIFSLWNLSNRKILKSAGLLEQYRTKRLLLLFHKKRMYSQHNTVQKWIKICYKRMRENQGLLQQTRNN
jgi:hypothetical protein